MATFDYEAEILPTVRELLTEFGRDVVLVKYDPTPDDNAKPWLGPTDPRSVNATRETLLAVNVKPATLAELGYEIVGDPEALARISSVLVADPGDNQTDFKDFDEVEDESESYKIVVVDKLRPANTTCLWFFGVEK